MIKKAFVVFLLFISLIATAQDNDAEKYLLTTRSVVFGISTPSFIDPYLSPMTYSGVGLNYFTDSRRYFKPDNTNYSMQSKFTLSGNFLMNPALSSEMLYLGANYGWGVNYHFRINKQLRILAGGLWDADFGFKNVPRNVNNPVNLDMATNLNLTGLILFDYPMRRRTLHFQLALQTPLLGCMYVPYGGASYYDMFELGSLTNAFHFSSIHNKLGLTQMYTVDVPCRKTTWRFGLRFQGLKYQANDLVFVQRNMSLIVGTTFDAISFGGRKKVAPQNFLSTND